MATHAFYNTIEKPADAEYKEKGSKFLAFAFPVVTVPEFKSNLHALKLAHPKATHHCFAYRIGVDGNTFRVSDAGEPSGSAGKPILGQIDSKRLTNTMVVVARYFGGTLLGVPGLINAYKSATALVLQLTPIIQKPVEVPYRLQFNYTQINEIMTIIKHYNCTVLEQELQLFCRMTAGIPVTHLQEVLYRFREMNNVEVEEK